MSVQLPLLLLRIYLQVVNRTIRGMREELFAQCTLVM